MGEKFNILQSSWLYWVHATPGKIFNNVAQIKVCVLIHWIRCALKLSGLAQLLMLSRFYMRKVAKGCWGSGGEQDQSVITAEDRFC